MTIEEAINRKMTKEEEQEYNERMNIWLNQRD